MAPTIFATGSAAVICTVGMPAFSNSVVIAAPLRVLVPQVEVRIIASMPNSLALAAISRPMRRVFDKRIGQARSGNKLFVQLTDDALPLEVAHDVQRHQPVRVLADKLRIVAAVGNLVIGAIQILAVFDAVAAPARRRRTLDLIRVALRHQPAVGDQHHLRLG